MLEPSLAGRLFPPNCGDDILQDDGSAPATMRHIRDGESFLRPAAFRRDDPAAGVSSTRGGQHTRSPKRRSRGPAGARRRNALTAPPTHIHGAHPQMTPTRRETRYAPSNNRCASAGICPLAGAAPRGRAPRRGHVRFPHRRNTPAAQGTHPAGRRAERPRAAAGVAGDRLPAGSTPLEVPAHSDSTHPLPFLETLANNKGREFCQE